MTHPNSFPHYATCPDEVAGLLAEEIRSLGGTDVRVAYRVVYFNATLEVAYAMHLHSRLASRIYRVLKDIPAHSPNIVFDKARRIRFDKLFHHEKPISITIGPSGDQGRIANHLIGSKIREAINDCFQHHQHVQPNQSSRDAVLGVAGYFHRGRLMVSLDTSRKSLHQRGFRVEGHPAPIKETLAAALLSFCGYDGAEPFYDPMCGSGTIAVEAALLATKRAPHLLRPPGAFGFEHLLDFDAALWQAVRCRAQSAVREAPAGIFASDIEAAFVGIAEKTAANAQLGTTIRFEQRDFFSSHKPAEHGLLIANIPYGQRLQEKEIDAAYLKAFGDHLKHHYKGWRCGILAPTSAPLKAIGLKPKKQAPFLNGTVPVKLVVFEIY